MGRCVVGVQRETGAGCEEIKGNNEEYRAVKMPQNLEIKSLRHFAYTCLIGFIIKAWLR